MPRMPGVRRHVGGWWVRRRLRLRRQSRRLHADGEGGTRATYRARCTLRVAAAAGPRPRRRAAPASGSRRWACACAPITRDAPRNVSRGHVSFCAACELHTAGRPRGCHRRMPSRGSGAQRTCRTAGMRRTLARNAMRATPCAVCRVWCAGSVRLGVAQRPLVCVAQHRHLGYGRLDGPARGRTAHEQHGRASGDGGERAARDVPSAVCFPRAAEVRSIDCLGLRRSAVGAVSLAVCRL